MKEFDSRSSRSSKVHSVVRYGCGCNVFVTFEGNSCHKCIWLTLHVAILYVPNTQFAFPPAHDDALSWSSDKWCGVRKSGDCTVMLGPETAHRDDDEVRIDSAGCNDTKPFAFESRHCFDIVFMVRLLRGFGPLSLV